MGGISTRRRDVVREEGFTLVELMVALIVISILVAIAIPTFLSARERSSNRAAQAKANTALKAHKAEAADGKGLPATTAQAVADLSDMEKSVTFEDLDGITEVKGAVYLKIENDDPTTPGEALTFVAGSKVSGKCFWTRDIDGKTFYATTDCPAVPTSWSSSGW